MKKFKTQLHKESDKIRLTASERRDVRARLKSYTEFYPLPQTTAVKNAAAYVSAQPYVLVKLNTFYTRFTTGVFAILLLIGVPLGAERAVPGDTLYPVKVRFNEELRSTLTLTEYQKVAWETTRIERRIAEARLLASEGKLTEAVEAEVAEAVREHTENAQEELKALRADDAEEAAIAEITFESALEVQSVVLAETQTEAASTTNGTSVGVIAVAVANAQESVAADKGTTTASYARLLGQVEQETTRAFALLASVQEVASAEETADIDRRLADIKRKVDEANTVLEEEAERATALLTKALSGTQKLITFMTDIDVRETVTVEELVPVELTDGERWDSVERSVSTIDASVEMITAAVPDVEAVDVRTKAELGLELLAAERASIDEALEIRDLEAAEAALAVAVELTRDLTIMTENAPIDLETEENATSTEATVETEAATSTETEVEIGSEETEVVETETEGEVSSETTEAEVAEETVEESTDIEAIDGGIGGGEPTETVSIVVE